MGHGRHEATPIKNIAVPALSFYLRGFERRQLLRTHDVDSSTLGDVGRTLDGLIGSNRPEHHRFLDAHAMVFAGLAAVQEAGVKCIWRHHGILGQCGKEDDAPAVCFPQASDSIILKNFCSVGTAMGKPPNNEGSESVRLMYLLSIACARTTTFIGNSYFVPDDLALDVLCAAANRGLRITMIVPGEKIDTQDTRRASRARWGRLLEAGVSIHEFSRLCINAKSWESMAPGLQ